MVPCRTGELELDRVVLPLHAFRQRSGAPSSSPVDHVEDKDDLDEKEENMLRCRQCDAGIAKSADRISHAGKHLHTFFNPAGVVYEIGCFSRASGCRVDGPMSREFAWFADYSWQIAFCSSCARHLGWFFSSGEDTFFGLIVNRLKSV